MGICGSNPSPSPEGKSGNDSNHKDVSSNYTKGKLLGKGGSCKVFKAHEVGDKNNLVAMKVMNKRERMNQDLYQKEIDILEKLSKPKPHNNIIKLVAYAEEKESFVIVSELCEGGELFDRIVDKNSKITEKRAAELVRTMLSAIQHCHEKNIVHRDLKPENFVFKTKDANSEMVLIDFGCAKEVEDLTEYKDLVGTPYYLAPESAAGHKYIRTGAVLKSSDIWSIGVIAFVLMTGRPPFNGHSNTEIFSSIIKKPLKFPHQVKLSTPFVNFCQNMLKKSPKRRYNLKKALGDAWLTGDAKEEPISDDVLRVLKQFNKQSKLKKAITKTLSLHMGAEPQKKIKAHFDRLDKDKNGALDIGELTQLLLDMGVKQKDAEEQAQEMMDHSDEDGNGEINFKEFAMIWQRKLLTVNGSYIDAVFNVLDEDGDGEITVKELHKVFGASATEAEVKEMIKEVDTNNDGVLSYEEFSKAMREQVVNGNIKGADNVGHHMKKGEAEAYKANQRDVDAWDRPDEKQRNNL